jgi:predicted MFS family arabinose efflux permease
MLTPVVALAIAMFAVGVDTYIVVSVIPAIADDLREPVAAVALVASAYALPTALLAPIFGPLSDRRGRRTAMTVGLIIFIGAAAASIVAPNLPLLLLTRGVNGLGAAIILPAVFAYAGDIPDLVARNKAMGVIASAFPLATLLGLPVGALIATAGGWRGAFVFVTIVGIMALVLVRVLLPADRPKTEQPLGYVASYRTILSDRSALKLLATTFVWFIAPLGLFVFLAEFIHVTYAIPTTQAGLFLLVVGGVGVVASRLSGRFMAVLGPRTAVLVAIGAFSTAAALMPLSTGALPLSVLVMGLWAAGTWFGVPAITAIMAAHSQKLRGTMLAFNSSAFSLSGVIGPILIGAIVTSAGFSAAFWVASLMGVGAFVLAWYVLPRRQLAIEPPAAA